MGLMDKFKNLFTDEEIIEDDDEDTVEIKEVKKEEPNKLPTFMREKIEKEEKEKKALLKIDDEDDINEGGASSISINEVELPKIEEKKTFKFPVDLEDNDFIETRSRQSVHNIKNKEEEVSETVSVKMERKTRTVQTEPKVADLYKDKREEKVDSKPKFKATPIISPIYGILDKNYTTGDIENSSRNNLEERRHSKSVDFDSVRKKAYGNLTQEIKENLMCENCEYLKEAKECKKTKNDIEENIVYEAMNNSKEEYVYDKQNYSKTNLEKDDYYRNECYKYQDITLDEATENYYDYGVEYEKAPDYNNKTKENNDDYIRLDETEEVVFNNTEERPVKSIPPVKSSINLLSTLKKSMGDEQSEKKNLELTDDLFNLIDSMYDERND